MYCIIDWLCWFIHVIWYVLFYVDLIYVVLLCFYHDVVFVFLSWYNDGITSQNI